MTWRDSCRPIIQRVIAEVGRSDLKALRKALREAYPYGERKYHPYKVWCDEVSKQVGTNSKDKLTGDLFEGRNANPA